MVAGGCSEKTRLLLFAAYVVSIVSALANPADLHYEDAYTLTQGANIIMLLLLAYCKDKPGNAFLASLLGVAFTLRTTGSWRGGSRWDSLLVTVGMLIILQQAFDQVLPAFVRHRRVLYTGFSLLVLPVLAALPHIINPPDVDTAVINEALRMSKAAYALPKTASSAIYDAATDTSAGVWRAGSTVYVAFAGSNSATDWKNNVNILDDAVPTKWGCNAPKIMRTHKGYTKAFESVAGRIIATALPDELRRGDTTRVVFCGHSLGGALATLAGLHAACTLPELQPKIAVVTFGAPQVGDGNFVAFFNNTVPACARVVNPMDPVPRLLSAQLVHVKGYMPVAALSLDSSLPLKAHALRVYADALRLPRWLSVVASFVPAVVAALAIAAYVAWQFRNT